MAFVGKSDFRVAKRYSAGFGILLVLASELPLRYSEEVLGDGSEKGLTLSGSVFEVFGAAGVQNAPMVGTLVSVVLRPGDTRRDIFDDLEMTREGFRFLLEGVSITSSGLEARWAHGAGKNRRIESLQIVGAPHLTFENPMRESGPRNGWLSLHLDGSATVFDVRGNDGIYVSHEFAFEQVVSRLKTALELDLKFRVTQRVLVPENSILIDDQATLETALGTLRNEGYTACVVRSFVPGTTKAQEVDVQLMSWPKDIPADGDYPGSTYEMPMLQETKRFVAMRDGEADACMELIPGYMLSLLGNKDTEKSTKHKFARGVVKGLSDSQKAMYGAQGYGPGISVAAVAEDGTVTGLTRLAIRTEGQQYPNLTSIPTPHFAQADKVTYANSGLDDVPIDSAG